MLLTAKEHIHNHFVDDYSKKRSIDMKELGGGGVGRKKRYQSSFFLT